MDSPHPVTHRDARSHRGRRSLAWDAWALGALVISVGFRAVALHRGGGWSGTLPYDSAVYFVSSINLLHGTLPYRDFLFLHPPGIALVLAPFAALSTALGEPLAFTIAKISWMVIGGINAALCGVILRHRGTLIATGAALSYAVAVAAIQDEVVPMLEAPANLILLLSILVLGLGAERPVEVTARRAFLVGLMLGLSPVIKIWGVVFVAIIVVGLAIRGTLRAAASLLAGVAATGLAVCLPFFLIAPQTMWRMVVVDQLGRPRSGRPLVERVNDILGLEVHGDVLHTSPATVLLTAGLVAAGILCLKQPGSRFIATLLAATVALAMSTPRWFDFYAAVTIVPTVLVAWSGLAIGLERLRQRQSLIRALLSVAVLLAFVVPSLPLLTERSLLGGTRFPSGWATRTVTSRPGCILSDSPNALIQMNVVRRNLDRGCRPDADIHGISHDMVGPERNIDRRSSPAYQAYILDYLRSGDTVLIAQRIGASAYMSATTKKIVSSWDRLDQRGPFVFRIPDRR